MYSKYFATIFTGSALYWHDCTGSVWIYIELDIRCRNIFPLRLCALSLCELQGKTSFQNISHKCHNNVSLVSNEQPRCECQDVADQHKIWNKLRRGIASGAGCGQQKSVSSTFGWLSSYRHKCSIEISSEPPSRGDLSRYVFLGYKLKKTLLCISGKMVFLQNVVSRGF